MIRLILTIIVVLSASLLSVIAKTITLPTRYVRTTNTVNTETGATYDERAHNTVKTRRLSISTGKKDDTEIILFESKQETTGNDQSEDNTGSLPMEENPNFIAALNKFQVLNRAAEKEGAKSTEIIYKCDPIILSFISEDSGHKNYFELQIDKVLYILDTQMLVTKLISVLPTQASIKNAPALPGQVKPSEPEGELKGFGSGFVITKDGYLITNHHVIHGTKNVKVKTDKGIAVAQIIAQDPDNDLSLLKIEGEFAPVSFAAERIAKLGQTIFTVGFPKPDLQGFSPKVTKGVISSLSGIHDDISMYQIDASIQPGNSGGPLADENGNIVGVIRSSLNDAETQNVNYTVKKSYVMAFIENNPDAFKQIQIVTESKPVSFEEAVEKVRKSTVLVLMY